MSIFTMFLNSIIFLQTLINEVNPTSSLTFFGFLSKVEQDSEFFDGVLVYLASMLPGRKISVVQTKYRWDSDDLNPYDIVIAHYNGMFMITKVGK